jgi:5-(carboxyamino)imidazole ribonucleotide synthase
MSAQPIAPGATLGVLGGGQLGRMFVQAAQRMGYRTVVLEPQVQCCAGQVAEQHLQFDYTDTAGLAALAQQASAITTEFENVPAQALEQLAGKRVVSPSAHAVALCQDRATEKAQLMACGVPCVPHALIASSEQARTPRAELLPGILKTTRLGYDGKGQASVNSADELERAWRTLGEVPCLLEQRLSLAYEVSVIVARSAAGHIVHLPVQQNLHLNGVLAVTQVPAPDVCPVVQAQAIAAAQKVATALQYVGVLCVEFFVLKDGTLLANEVAPRPHNSGHYSIEACDFSQFDLQVRTLARLPLVMPRQHSPAVMLNVLGEAWFFNAAVGAAATEPNWSQILSLPGVHLHLYGKQAPRLGRKMGHITITASTACQARDIALDVTQRLGLPAW